MKDRFDQGRIFLRIVFQIGVLDQDDVAGRMGETGAESRPLALVLFVIDDLLDQRCYLGLQKFAGAVAGAIVDDDDLDLTYISPTDAIYDSPDGMQFVVTRNHNRKREIVFIDHEASAPLVGIVICFLLEWLFSADLTCA